MQYEVMEVALGDIRFNENNPRRDMGDLETLAASFTDGEPITPPIVARDGSAYRLFDGERRVRAMQLLGTERCHVNVYPSFVAAEAAIASMATNLKKSLDSTEQAQGFQTMLEYDLSDEGMRRATGMDMEKVRTVRRVLGESDGAVQTSLGAIFEAAAFDDPDDRRRVLEAGVYAEREAMTIRREKRTAKAREKILAALRKLGVPDERISDGQKPADAEKEMGLEFLGYIRKPKDAKELLDGFDAEKVAVWLSDSSWELSYLTYVDADEFGRSAGVVAERRTKLAYERLQLWMARARKGAIAWYVGAYEQSGSKFTRINTKVCKARRGVPGIDEDLAAIFSVSRPSMYEVCEWIGNTINTRVFYKPWNESRILINGQAKAAAEAWQMLEAAGWVAPEGTPVVLPAALASQDTLDSLVEGMTEERA